VSILNRLGRRTSRPADTAARAACRRDLRACALQLRFPALILSGIEAHALERPAAGARLRALVGKGDHSWEEIEQRVRIFQPERRTSNPAHFSTAAAATLKRRRLWIRHYNRAEDRVTEREVSPQRLVLYRDNWYLDAYCHLRQDLRSFAVDAIQAAELRETKAKEVPAAELDAYLGGGYGIFAGETLQWAKLRFSPKMARWVSAQEWHPQQRSRTEADGSLILEVPYADDRELVMEILKFGADVEVLAPPTLRSRIAAILTDTVAAYK
jgi:predicted DNA-binding transcriptional regulator YafY